MTCNSVFYFCRLRLAIDLRYIGQNFELLVPTDETDGSAPSLPDMEEMKRRFFAAHEKTYGHYTADDPIETVNLRLTAIGEAERIPPPAVTGDGSKHPAPTAHRRVWFDGTEHDTPVYDRATFGAGTDAVEAAGGAGRWRTQRAEGRGGARRQRWEAAVQAVRAAKVVPGQGEGEYSEW